MRTFRGKLTAIVALCLLPALAAAWLRAREAKSELAEEVRTRLDSVDESFLSDLSDDLAGEALALRLAASQPAALESAEVRATLSKVYADSKVLTATAEAEGPLAPEAAEGFRPLWQGREVVGLFRWGSALKYALVVAVPVLDAGHQRGAIALVTPLDGAFLAHEKVQIGSDWALRVNGDLVAHNPENPDPSLHLKAEQTGKQGVVAFEEVGEKYFAFNTFQPPAMQAPGQVALMTATRDVTDLRQSINRGLRRSLAILGGALLAALAAAMAIAGGMLDTVRKIAAAAETLKSGKYQRVAGVTTRDELGQLAETFNQMVTGLEERDHLKETFGKYVSRQVAEHVLRSKGLGGENVQVTVLFSDIRGFTTISERMEPKALLDFLNMYFTSMVEAVMTHHGVVDKFIGDCIMAVFGAPVPHPDDAYRAVQSALDMRSKLKTLNETFRARGLPELRAGIGIHTGTVVAGNMGHTERREYTVIGDSVNLASRLESMTKELQVDILLSEDTYQLVKDRIEAEPLRRITVKGRTADVMVYRLVGPRGEAAKAA